MLSRFVFTNTSKMMKCTQFDAHNNRPITIEIVGPSFAQRIEGKGYFIIVNPNSTYVSFSKSRHDICLGDVTENIIPNYTNQDYANEYGSRTTGYKGMTVKQYMQQNCRMIDIK